MAGATVRSEWKAWDWLDWHPDGGWRESRGYGEEATQKRIGLGKSTSPVLTEPGIHICFLPNIGKPGDELCTQLSSKFAIPEMFWESIGWEGNGYFWARPQSDKRTFASVARFLVKEVQWHKDTHPDEWYDWLYFGFASFFAPPSPQSSGLPCTVLLAFLSSDKKRPFDWKSIEDLSGRLQRRTDTATLQHSPFGIYNMIMEPLLYSFDTSLWGFRRPVRGIETMRLSIGTATPERFEEMHELSRHIIHASETLDAASRVIERMARCQMESAQDLDTTVSHGDGSVVTTRSVEAGASTDNKSSDDHGSTLSDSREQSSPKIYSSKNSTLGHQIQEDLLFYANFLTSLKLRASSFEKRLKNEILLAHHTVTANESSTQKNILKAQEDVLSEMRNDGKSVAKLVAYISITFLPGSFFAGFFGMNVLSFQPTNTTSAATYWSQDGWQVSHQIWIPSLFIVISTAFCWLLLTFSGLLSFVGDTKRRDNEKEVAVMDTDSSIAE